MTKVEIQRKLVSKRERLELYLEREKTMLSDGVQSYGLGSRNISRYNTDLQAIQDTIESLESEIEELEGLLSGRKPRKAVGVIIRDW